MTLILSFTIKTHTETGSRCHDNSPLLCCESPLCHSQRSAGEIHSFYCRVTLHQWRCAVTRYLLFYNSENRHPKHPSTVYCYLMEGGVCLVFFFCLFFLLFSLYFFKQSKTATQLKMNFLEPIPVQDARLKN